MEYTFTLKYQLSAKDCDPDDIIERLGAAGCDDALVGTGRRGRLALDFTREGESAQQAVRSAMDDVRCAIPTATLIEAAPDFVGLTDIAAIAGVSRQAMRQMMLAHPSDFPPPVHEGRQAIWHLAEVLDWLEQRGNYPISPSILETAAMTQALNLARVRRQPQHGQEQRPSLA
jgi:predicted DNA-binding transcriptional regulator AlpA